MHINTIGIDAKTDHKHGPTETANSQSENGSDVLLNVLFRLGSPQKWPHKFL